MRGVFIRFALGSESPVSQSLRGHRTVIQSHGLDHSSVKGVIAIKVVRAADFGDDVRTKPFPVPTPRIGGVANHNKRRAREIDSRRGATA